MLNKVKSLLNDGNRMMKFWVCSCVFFVVLFLVLNFFVSTYAAGFALVASVISLFAAAINSTILILTSGGETSSTSEKSTKR